MLTKTDEQRLAAILDDASVKSKVAYDNGPAVHLVDASPASKGLIECSGADDLGGTEIPQYGCITQKELGPHKATKGVK